MTRQQKAFTLVELMMVIALSGLVALMIGTVLSYPLEAFSGQSRRAELVDIAASALQRMSREVRLAIPNSLRVSADGQALELLLIHSAARYRPNRLGEQGLRFSNDSAGTCGSTTQGGRCDSFQVMDGTFDPDGARWLVLYNTGATGSNVWVPSNPGSITPTGTLFSKLTGAPTGESHIALSNLPTGGFRFAFASPQYRLYLAETVVGYRCQGSQLLRYSYNSLESTLPDSPPKGSNPQPLARSLSSCSFTYQPGSTQRAGLLSFGLGISKGGESLQLLQQVHVDNAP